MCTILLLGVTATGLPAQTFTTLASFTYPGGAEPESPLVQGIDGDFYGTTLTGGANDAGTVFKITPAGILTTLYSFCSLPACADGSRPISGLIQGSDGNFYGTTTGLEPSVPGNFGTVFKITPAGTLTTLYSFCSQENCADGGRPGAGLVQATDGNFYGTTTNGGSSSGSGTVFKITPGGVLTTLHSFCSQGPPCPDGTNPSAALIQANDGNFYGTTQGEYAGDFKGSDTEGTVFQITPGGTLTTLYSFCSKPNCTDGNAPFAGLIQGSDGNFYGTTRAGGNSSNSGTIFRITPDGTLTTLYSFCSQSGCADGSTSVGWLVQATDGNFYGTTLEGGNSSSAGTIFKMTPDATLTTLHRFCAPQSDCHDGSGPHAALIQGSDGNLYGTTTAGPIGTQGTVFKLALSSSPIPPAIDQSGGVVSGASYQAGIVANSFFTIFGTNFSSMADNWSNAIVDGNLPTSLYGLSAMVGGAPAYIVYISPTQINAIVPNVAPGPTSVTVTNLNGSSNSISAVVPTVQPAFFQWGRYAAATHQDFSLAMKDGTFPGVTTAPAKPDEVIILWGTGFGPTSPLAPLGVNVPWNATYNTANAVTVTVGGAAASVYGAALAPGFAGLYQVAIQIPASLANGDYPVIATVSGVESPSIVLITVQE